VFTKEEFLKTKCLVTMVKLRIERGEYLKAMQFIRDCMVYDTIVEVYEVFQAIKKEMTD
jgi:NTP pyrophosphatase (non-canonical NTP hydrolase)